MKLLAKPFGFLVAVAITFSWGASASADVAIGVPPGDTMFVASFNPNFDAYYFASVDATVPEATRVNSEDFSDDLQGIAVNPVDSTIWSLVSGAGCVVQRMSSTLNESGVPVALQRPAEITDADPGEMCSGIAFASDGTMLVAMRGFTGGEREQLIVEVALDGSTTTVLDLGASASYVAANIESPDQDAWDGFLGSGRCDNDVSSFRDVNLASHPNREEIYAVWYCDSDNFGNQRNVVVELDLGTSRVSYVRDLPMQADFYGAGLDSEGYLWWSDWNSYLPLLWRSDISESAGSDFSLGAVNFAEGPSDSAGYTQASDRPVATLDVIFFTYDSDQAGSSPGSGESTTTSTSRVSDRCEPDGSMAALPKTGVANLGWYVAGAGALVTTGLGLAMWARRSRTMDEPQEVTVSQVD